MNAKDKVDLLINLQQFGKNSLKRIMIGKTLYKQFLEEVEPIYKELYGALLSHERFPSYQNIFYRGIAVCLDMEAEENHES